MTATGDHLVGPRADRGRGALEKTRHVGIYHRHRAGCSRASGCSCPYQATVWSARESRNIRRQFRLLAEARTWQQDAAGAVKRGVLRAPTAITLAEAWTAWLEGARAGLVRNRKHEPYKPAVLRTYERAVRLRVLPELGSRRLGSVTDDDLQQLVQSLTRNGASGSTVRNTVIPLQALYRHHRKAVPLNPTAGLDLPLSDGVRDRVADKAEAAALLEALPLGDRALWATAMYAGLRRGELRALRWGDVDLAGGVIGVARAWDDVEGEIEVKSRAGRRKVPIAAILRDQLVEHRMRAGDVEPAAFVFAGDYGTTFIPDRVRRRALKAWKAAGLEPIGLHECRHSFASLMIAAGVNAKALSTYMGHASVAITFDRYGHLMPGNELAAAGLLDAYLGAAESARAAGSGGGPVEVVPPHDGSIRVEAGSGTRSGSGIRV